MQETRVNEYNLTAEKIPFQEKAIIEFNTLNNCKAMIKIMNNEEEVRLLMNEAIDTGKHTVVFDFSSLPKAIYTIKLIAETETSIDKETILIHI